jgi:hypothetical protein
VGPCNFYNVCKRTTPFVHKFNAVMHGLVTVCSNLAYEALQSLTTVVLDSLNDNYQTAAMWPCTGTKKVLPSSLSISPTARRCPSNA